MWLVVLGREDSGGRAEASAVREHGQTVGAGRRLAALASATGACFPQTELLNRGLGEGRHSWFLTPQAGLTVLGEPFPHSLPWLKTPPSEESV